MEDITKALESQTFLKLFEVKAKDFRKMRDQVFAKNLGYDSVTGALIAAFKNRTNPIERMDEIAKAAQDAGPEALESMRWSMWDVVFAKARSQGGGYDIADIKKSMDEPIQPGSPSLREFMEQRGLMAPETLARLDTMLAYADNIVNGIQAIGISDPIPPPGMLEGMFTRMVGAEAARRGFAMSQKLQGSGGQIAGGPTLIVSSAGSNALSTFLSKLPTAKIRTTLQDALAGAPVKPGGGPFSLLEVLLEGPTSAQDAIRQVQRVNIYMWNAGLHGLQQTDFDISDEDGIIPGQ